MRLPASLRTNACAFVAAVAVLTCARAVHAETPTPEAYFGFRMGAEGRLAAAEQIEAYFNLVALQSDRVTIVDIGPTTEGRRTIAAIVSAPSNIRALERIRADNQRLADPRTLSPVAARQIAAAHKVVVAIGAGIHPLEVTARRRSTSCSIRWRPAAIPTRSTCSITSSSS